MMIRTSTSRHEHQTISISPIPDLHRFPFIWSAIFILFGLSLSLLLCNTSLMKAAFLLLGAVALGLVFLFPEFGLVLSFSSGIFKEWLSVNVNIFHHVDFTLVIYFVTFCSILCFLVRKGILPDRALDRSLIPLTLFSGMLLLSVLYTPSFQYGSFKAFSFVCFNWSLFLFPLLIIHDEKTAWRMIWILGIVGVAVSIFTITNVIVGIVHRTILATYRASFLGTNPISFAGWVGVIDIVLISALPRIEGRRHKILLLVPILLLTTALLVANSRGPAISFLITLSLILFMRLRRGSRKALIWAVGLLMLIVIIWTALPPQLTSRYTEMVTQEQSSRYVAFYTINSRLAFWRSSLEMATSSFRTFFLGVGCGGFSSVFAHQDARLYPHNMFLEVLSEIGLIGLLLLLWFLVSILRRGLRALSAQTAREQKTLILTFFMAAVYTLTTAQFSGDLNDGRRLWFALGTLLAVIHCVHATHHAKLPSHD